jgi:hypothetical protein
MALVVNTKVVAFSEIVNNLHNYDSIPQKVLLMNFLIVLQDFTILRTYNKKRSSLCLTYRSAHHEGIWSMYRSGWR